MHAVHLIFWAIVIFDVLSQRRTGYDNIQEEDVVENTCLPTCESQASRKQNLAHDGNRHDKTEADHQCNANRRWDTRHKSYFPI